MYKYTVVVLYVYQKFVCKDWSSAFDNVQVIHPRSIVMFYHDVPFPGELTWNPQNGGLYFCFPYSLGWLFGDV